MKLLSFALLIFVAGPLAAQSPSGSQAVPAPGVKAKDPDRIICQREEQLGSRLGGRKVCMTAAEWDQLRRDSREAVDNFQRQATAPGMPSGA